MNVRPSRANPPSGRLLGFIGRRSNSTPARAHILAELLALLGRHPFPALGHWPPPFGAIMAVTTKASEEHPAENQQSESLPEGNLPPSEQHRQQPVPQMHDHFAANPDENRERQRGHKKDPFVSLDPIVFHVVFLISS